VNLILLFDEDFVAPEVVRLTGRRLAHVTSVLRPTAGDTLTVGRLGGNLGRGEVMRLDAAMLELRVALDTPPPPKLPVTLVLALPRPKVLNRVLASATSLGVQRIVLINAWRVEKSYWKSPKMAEENLFLQCVLGLEQAKDTVMPSIQLQRLFRPFVEKELSALASDSLALVAHPVAARECPRSVTTPVTLAIGPEGGFIAAEVDSLIAAGFEPVTIGERILRVETAVAALLARLF
jgi:16S rRNA (uracil1498-N3)-methyltransferase